VAYGYYWYKETNVLRLNAISVIDKADHLDILENAVNAERARCENFISQQEGDFGSFEYCKKLINWADTLPITQ